MSLVGDTLTLKVKDSNSTVEITGEVLEKYTGTRESSRGELDNANYEKSVKIRYSVDYYMIKLADNTVRHILCSDVVEIVP